MILKMCAVGFTCFALAGAASYVDSQAGEGTAKDSIGYGVGQSSGMVGELFKVPGQLMTDIKPGLQDMQQQMSGVLGGAVGGTTVPATSNDVPAQEVSPQ